jgi:hypothetical protein
MPTFITLPRSELYERVWSKPVREVAAEFGISDVALAKRCRALRIPLPPRGYWARVAAGQRPRRPPLPPFTERKRSALPTYVTTRDAQGQPADEPALQFETDRQSHKVTAAGADEPEVTVAPTADLTTATAIVKRTARHLKHPRRADLTFAHGEGSGPILHLHVSPELLDRALLFADTFLRACAEQGWNPIPPKKPEPPDPRHYFGQPPEPKPHVGPHYAELDVNGHRIEFHIEEPFDLRELPPTPADLNRQKRDSWFRPEKHHETIWSGRLRLKRPGYRYPYGIDGKSWYDTRGRTVEALIPRILADFQAVAARMQEKDDELERDKRERERQAKLAAELSARRTANAELIHTLEAQAGAWARAQLLRRYLRAARRSLGDQTITADRQGQPIDFLAWAEHYVNQLDPLHPEPRDPDLAHERTFQYGADEKRFTEELQRLLGHTWEGSAKLC